MHRLALLNHKCGTTYVKKVLTKLCHDLDFNIEIYQQKSPERDQRITPGKLFTEIKSMIKHHLTPRKKPVITFVNNSNYDKLFSQLKGEYKGFHIVRDPRDTIISGYFSHLNSHPVEGPWAKRYLIKHREWLKSVSKDEGIHDEIQRGYALNLMNKWYYDDPDILEIKFESLTKEPFEMFSKIFNHIDIDIDKNHLASILDEFSFKNLSGGRKKGQEDVNSHFRKGVPGDWKNHFTQEHIDLFKQKWGDLIIRLGYEKDITWEK